MLLPKDLHPLISKYLIDEIKENPYQHQRQSDIGGNPCARFFYSDFPCWSY